MPNSDRIQPGLCKYYRIGGKCRHPEHGEKCDRKDGINLGWNTDGNMKCRGNNPGGKMKVRKS